MAGAPVSGFPRPLSCLSDLSAGHKRATAPQDGAAGPLHGPMGDEVVAPLLREVVTGLHEVATELKAGRAASDKILQKLDVTHEVVKDHIKDQAAKVIAASNASLQQRADIVGNVPTCQQSVTMIMWRLLLQVRGGRLAVALWIFCMCACLMWMGWRAV